MTAYRAYVQFHGMLTQCQTEEECARVAGQLIMSYMDNRLMWQELEYYRQHHSILGKHPIFSEFSRRRKLLSMRLHDLLERRRRVEANLARNRLLERQGGNPEVQARRSERIRAYEAELADINRIIGE